MEKKPIRKIGKYEIISKVAEGGMGSLYKARHPTLDRVVLLKKLALRGGSQFVERFKREARLMMDFKNDHIVQVHDHFKEGPHYFIVEEYVDGISLDALIRRERYLSNDAALLILYEVCKALRYAHDKQVIHRDIKPGNVLLSRHGEVKLADFGIATSLEETDDGLTREGMVLGTPAYIPPEQIDDAKNVDRRADIYSVGVVLYEMLTGKTPYPGSFTAETVHLIQKGRYTPPRKLNPRASRLLRSIGRRCMKVKPKRRYQDLGEIVRILEKRIRRRDPESLRQAVKNVVEGKDIGDLLKRRRTWLAWFLPVIVIAGLAAAGGWWLYRQGWWFETFAAGRYGVLVVSAVVDGAYKAPEEIFFQPVLYKDEETQLTRIAGIDFGLHRDQTRASAESFTISSEKMYLEAGRYRLKVSLEGELFWRSFTLEPRFAQRRLLSTADGLLVTVRQDSRPRPLEVSAAVSDAVTGEDLSGSTAISVFVRNRWMPWAATAPQEFVSGGSYRFRFDKDGYYAQTYSLLVKPYQTLLNFDVGLVPEPGTLILHSSAASTELFLNGSDYYFSGGRDGRFQKLAPLGIENRQLELNPGDYRLTVRRPPAAEKTVSFHLVPHASVSVNVAFDVSQGTLEVTLNEQGVRMTTLARRLILIALGFLAGMCAWPAAELILFLQAGFPSYLVFSLVLGAVTGALVGAFFGAAEGITSRIKSRIPAGVALGAAVGCIGGGAGLVAGQAALWIVGALVLQSYGNFQGVVLPVSHAIGWGIVGMFVGAAEGVRAGSAKKIGVGILGGLAGGLVGGFVLEYSRLLLPHLAFSRLLGLVILGLAVGVFYGLIEQGMSFGIFRILTGGLKGKEFLLNQKRMRLGRSKRNEIALPAYEDLADLQARVRIQKGDVILTNLEPRLPILVNEQEVEERKLKFGDVIRIGSARIFFKYE